MPQTFEIGIKAVITNTRNEVLLLKCTNKHNAYWDLPGGRMEPQESIIDTLHRELSEELPSIANIHIHNLIDTCIPPFILPNNNALMLLIYHVSADLSHVTLSTEHTQYKWVHKDEISLLHDEATLMPAYQKLLEQLL